MSIGDMISDPLSLTALNKVMGCHDASSLPQVGERQREGNLGKISLLRALSLWPRSRWREREAGL